MNRPPITRRAISLISVAMALASSAAAAWAWQSTRPRDDSVRILRPARTTPVLACRAQLSEGYPSLRGFRAPILDSADRPWPFQLPADAPGWQIEAESLISKHLAVEGLLTTTSRVLSQLDSKAPTADDSQRLEQLKAVGLPVDLLACFHLPDAGLDERAESRATRVIAYLRRQASATQPGSTNAHDAFVFDFRQTCPGFRVASESGEHDIGLIRLQMTRGTDWIGPNDGGCLDVARQLTRAFPDSEFFVAIEDRHLPDFQGSISDWSIPRGGLTISGETYSIAQWAQDNGKPGLARDPKTGADRVVTLAPRFASREEVGARFVPGETFAIEGLAAAGHAVLQSPLLFQGGNLLCVTDPAAGARTLLIGEAEIHRNVALGLTGQQVLDAFRIEFGVDRCVVLPAVAFHIDYEVTVRAVGGRLVAFVNDAPTAVRNILACGVDALERAGRLTSEAAKTGRSELAAGRIQPFMEVFAPALLSAATGPGQFPESFANLFSTGPVDSGVGNLQRVLLAMDMLSAASTDDAQLPLDPHAAAYFRSFARLEADRARLHKTLSDLGWRIVGVPSLGDSKRSINYLNGIHDRTRYLMPAYGGLFAPLDREAADAFRRELTGVTIVPILCGESQRREGGLHCSASVYPRVAKQSRDSAAP